MMIKIDFEMETRRGIYRDALVLPDNHGLTDTQIEAMKQQRVDNWLAVVEAPPPPPEPDMVDVGGKLYTKVVVEGVEYLKPVEV